MKVKGLNGRVYEWKLAGHVAKGGEDDGSGLHDRVRKLLMKLFPNEPRLEEVPLPGSGNLRGDFYLPARRLMVEANGRQHYEFVQFYHVTKLGFIQACKRDQNKRDWCITNDISCVELPHYESEEQWIERILHS